MARMADGSQSPKSSGKAVDPEVTARAKRRSFTAGYKLRILREVDALSDVGGIGELLRREGLYSSHLTTWRQARERGELGGLAPKKRSRKANPDKPLLDENKRLEREKARLAKKLAQAEAIIEIQKEVAAMLAEPDPNDGRDS